MLRWLFMQLADIFLGLGEEPFTQLVRSISLGKLKTYQMYERIKTRLRVTKLNTEALKKVAPRCWERLSQPGNEEFTLELSQAILISHMDMIKAVLDEVGIPHEEGFFAKDLDASKYLTDGWQKRVYTKFKGVYPDGLLLFYINHLGWELLKTTEIYLPQAEEAGVSSS